MQKELSTMNSKYKSIFDYRTKVRSCVWGGRSMVVTAIEKCSVDTFQKTEGHE